MTVPVEFFAALSFLALSADSPFYQQRDIPQDITLDVAEIPQRATATASPVIQTLVQVGGPMRPDAV